MKRVLVTGAGGVAGRFLLRRLSAAGVETHALSRAPRGTADAKWHRGDLTTERWDRTVPEIDTVFHLAPLWLLPDALPALRRLRVRRLIAFGSTSVRTKAESPSPAEREIVERLRVAERRIAAETGFAAWTLFRPTLIYGAGLDRNVSAIAGFILRFGFFPLAGAAAGLRQPVHADDLAAACLAAAEAPVCHEQVFDLGGGETLSYREMVRRIFVALDRSPRIVTLPPGLLSAGVRMARRLPGLGHADPAMIERMRQDMWVDNAPAHRAFGYAPRGFDPKPADLLPGLSAMAQALH